MFFQCPVVLYSGLMFCGLFLCLLKTSSGFQWMKIFTALVSAVSLDFLFLLSLFLPPVILLDSSSSSSSTSFSSSSSSSYSSSYSSFSSSSSSSSVELSSLSLCMTNSKQGEPCFYVIGRTENSRLVTDCCLYYHFLWFSSLHLHLHLHHHIFVSKF